jgi:hypothetical protein
MSKKLLSESQVNRWSKLANIKTGGKRVLNEMGHGMAYGREDEEGMAPEEDMGGDMGDMGADAEMDMGGEEPMDMDLGAGEAGPEEEMSLDDDKLMSMIKDAVKAALVDAGLSDEGGDEEMDMGDMEMDTEGEEADGGGDGLSAEPGEEGEEEVEEEEEEAPLEEVQVVTNDEIINETLKRVIKRLRK